MSSFSLRLPYLIYLSIGSMLFGVLVAPAFREMPESAVSEASGMAVPAGMEHATRAVPAETAPSLVMSIEKDPTDGWNVTLNASNFTFAPGMVGQDHVPNTGHAHLYIGGVKFARLYGPHFHVPDLPAGEHQITVTLSGNDHAYYTIGGERIEVRTVILQGESSVPGN